jgi:hypothetical protein
MLYYYNNDDYLFNHTALCPAEEIAISNGRTTIARKVRNLKYMVK